MVRPTALTALLLAAAVGAQVLPRLDAVVEPLAVDTPAGGPVEGHLDWTTGTVTVIGEGLAPDDVTHPVQRRLLGFRAAKMVAYRNLLEVVGGVQIDAGTTVNMAMVASDSVRARVEGLVRGARVVPGSQLEADGVYRLELRLDLRGDLAAAVLPDSAALALRPPAELPGIDSVIVFVPPEPHTGLVIDARGTGLRPSLSPRIVDDSGRVIYAADHVERDEAVRTGVVAYERDLPRAVVSDRVGGRTGNPFLVQAIGVAGLYSADVVVTRDMGTRIRMADTGADFLRHCRVVFVVGPRPAPPPAVGGATTPGAAPAADFLDSVLQARAVADSGGAR